MAIKVVYNQGYGGYDLSKEAVRLLKEMGVSSRHDDFYDLPRHDPRLVKVVEKLGAYRSHDGCSDHRNAPVIPRHLSFLHDPYFDRWDELPGHGHMYQHDALRICVLKGDRYIVHEYDGLETVVEPHHIRWIVVPSTN